MHRRGRGWARRERAKGGPDPACVPRGWRPARESRRYAHKLRPTPRRHAPGASPDLETRPVHRGPARPGSAPPSGTGPVLPPLRAAPLSSDGLSLEVPGRVPGRLRGSSVLCAALWWAGPEPGLWSARPPSHKLTVGSRGPRPGGSPRHAGAERTPKPTGTPTRTQHEPLAYAHGPPRSKTAATCACALLRAPVGIGWRWGGETSAAAHWLALLAREFNGERGTRRVPGRIPLLRARFPARGPGRLCGLIGEGAGNHPPEGEWREREGSGCCKEAVALRRTSVWVEVQGAA